MSTGDATLLPYHEPDIVTILILASFLILLNLVNHIVDHVIYVGLLGQVFLGIAYGTPGGKLLGSSVETTVVNLGYLGLLCLVYEGGLTTSFRALKANLLLSLAVAVTGVVLPIGLSFVLVDLVGATPLQAFTAGAALCSTSLGTTFTLMQTSGLNVTRMGVVLTSAAMMDDIVGLVMVQIITSLGPGSKSFSAATVIRPIFVSVGFGLAITIMCRFVVLPVATVWYSWRSSDPNSWHARLMSAEYTALVAHTLTLVAMVTGATYAGTSNLFAAYLTGAAISWWDHEVHHHFSQNGTETVPKRSKPSASLEDRPLKEKSFSPAETDRSQSSTIPKATASEHTPQNQPDLVPNENSGIAVFEKYFQPSLQRILRPFFFASIGFSIPITKMFSGAVVWRGIVYTVLMSFTKLACGLWLIRWRRPSWFRWRYASTKKSKSVEVEDSTKATSAIDQSARSEPPVANTGAKLHPPPQSSHATPSPGKPRSLYPSCIVGFAMVARGEIGFLISSLGQSTGIFGDSEKNLLFLVVTWAIMLCTIIGPTTVGLMVKRVKRLNQATSDVHRADVLGNWGVTG